MKPAPSVDFIQTQYTYLRSLYSPRNAEYNVLRRVFDGDFASIQEQKTSPDTLFNDRIKVVYNIANATVRRYMDSMSSPPKLQVTPRGFDEKDVVSADAKSKWLEHIYRANSMPMQLVMSAYYQALLDRAIFHVRPAPETPHKISIELAIPDNFMPMPAGEDWRNYPFTIYGFRKLDPNDITIDPLTAKPNSLFHNVIEYWDNEWFVKVEDGVEKLRIHHEFGVQPWHQSMNIPIPHRYRGQGDVDQAVGLNEYLNMLFSDMADMINYAANPIAVVRGSKAGATNLPFAPRAVWELERDGQAGFLQWSGAPPTAEAQILRTIQAIEDASGVSSPAFGREIPSGTSGSAVRSLLAGFNTRLGTKQQMLGEALAQVNRSAMLIAERLFPNQEYNILGEVPNSDGKRGYTITPKEFNGWYENEVIFEPVDATTRFFQEMEKYNKKIQSRFTTMKNLGVKNVSDELDRIQREAREDAENANNLALGGRGELAPAQPGQGPTPIPGPASTFDPAALTQGLDQNALRELLGGAIAKPGAKAGQKPVPPPTGSSNVGGVNQPVNLPEVNPRIGIDEVLSRIRPTGVQGALTGPLAKQGYSEGTIDFAIQSPADEGVIRRALGPLSDRARFSRVEGVPQEEHIPFGAGVKKKVNESSTVTLDSFLSVVVMGIENTPNAAFVYTVGVLDDKDNLMPIAKTFPQRKIEAEQGEIITIHIAGISRKFNAAENTWRYSLAKPEVVRSSSVPAKPSSIKTIENKFQGVK